jgi:hypothetical protein
MKVKIPLVLLLLIAGAVGYLLGTDAGRAQRDVILVKLGKKEEGDSLEAAATGAAEAVADAASDAAEAVSDAASDAVEEVTSAS